MKIHVCVSKKERNKGKEGKRTIEQVNKNCFSSGAGAGAGEWFPTLSSGEKMGYPEASFSHRAKATPLKNK